MGLSTTTYGAIESAVRDAIDALSPNDLNTSDDGSHFLYYENLQPRGSRSRMYTIRWDLDAQIPDDEIVGDANGVPISTTMQVIIDYVAPHRLINAVVNEDFRLISNTLRYDVHNDTTAPGVLQIRPVEVSVIEGDRQEHGGSAPVGDRYQVEMLFEVRAWMSRK